MPKDSQQPEVPYDVAAKAAIDTFATFSYVYDQRQITSFMVDCLSTSERDSLSLLFEFNRKTGMLSGVAQDEQDIQEAIAMVEAVNTDAASRLMLAKSPEVNYLEMQWKVPKWMQVRLPVEQVEFVYRIVPWQEELVEFRGPQLGKIRSHLQSVFDNLNSSLKYSTRGPIRSDLYLAPRLEELDLRVSSGMIARFDSIGQEVTTTKDKELEYSYWTMRHRTFAIAAEISQSRTNEELEEHERYVVNAAKRMTKILESTNSTQSF